MKIVFVIKTLVHSVGGAEKLAAQLAGEMAAGGVDMHLVTFDRPDDEPFYAVDDAVNRHAVNTADTSQKTGLFEYPKLLWRIRREIVALHPDCVVAFMHSAFVPVQCALLGTGIKVVLSEHTVPAYYKNRKFEFALLRFFSIFAASVTIISERIRTMYPRMMREKMTILPNMIDSDFEPADVIAADKNVKTILSVARLNADKDHAVLINAFALISDEFRDWNLLIVGEGEERKNLENLILSYGLQSRISLPGAMKDMNAVYKNAQIFVHPSKYENFGLVTAEAMSHALPAIGFADCPGTNELIRDGENGILVNVRTPEVLALAIAGFMRSGGLRLQCGKKSYALAHKNFSKDTARDEWKKYLRSI